MRYFVDQHWELDPRTRPFDADSVVLPSEAVRGQLQAEGLDSSGLVLRRLNSILSAERLSWGYSTGGPEDYTFTLQARIRQWRSIRSPGQYVRALAALEPEPQPPPPLYPSPLSLPAAVDFLDSEWQLNVRMRHLFHDLRALTAAKLALPCTSLEEFESRVSAVYDVLSSIKVPETDEVKARRARGETVGPLERLRLYLNTHLDDAGAGRVEAAINTLKAVVDVRSGSQHAGASRRLPRGYRALGLRYPPASWGSAWEHVQGRTVEALEAIREEIQQIRRRA